MDLAGATLWALLGKPDTAALVISGGAVAVRVGLVRCALATGSPIVATGRHVEGAEIGKKGACHVFRHTMATAMLEHAADVRYAQEMLVHASLATTQIYTRVSIKQPKDIHTATHPSAPLERRPSPPSPSSNGEPPARSEAVVQRTAGLAIGGAGFDRRLGAHLARRSLRDKKNTRAFSPG